MENTLTVSGLILAGGGASLYVAGPAGMLVLGLILMFGGIVTQSGETQSE
jgi:hypothetical protein